MEIEENRIVTLTYELRESGPQGTVLEVMDTNWPFKFFFGGGNLLPAFEDHIQGLKPGESFEFTLPPEQAYGPVQEQQVIDLPRAPFDDAEGNILAEGNFVTVTDQNGNQHNGQIVTFNDSTVSVNFNHVMAGKSLHFKGVVLEVREATTDELIRKSYVHEDGVHGSEDSE